MEKRVVITGLGIVAPDAKDVGSFWQNLKKGHCAIRKISKCDTKALKVRSGGQIDYEFPEEEFNRRFIKKCDDFSIYSLFAVHEALKDAKLDVSSMDSGRIGVYVGNNSGGWRSAQDGLINLHSGGVEAISPYLASNWFPAAPQGHISIYYGIKGYSKTVVGDMASSNIAIGNAYKIVKNGKADVMVAGGTENLMVKWALVFYQTSGILSFSDANPEKVYQPFGRYKSGVTLAEGAAFVVLESLESAQERNAHIYAEVSGFGLTNDGCHYLAGDESGEQYGRAVTLAVNGETPDVVMLNGVAYDREDKAELNAVRKAFGSKANRIKFTCPKAFYGHSYGAAAAMDVVTACMSMKENMIIKSGNFGEMAPESGLDFVTSSNIDKAMNSSLVMSKGLGGINTALFLKKFSD
jgi:3-oxoacyl-(acyl-carrier-protein) synthase